MLSASVLRRTFQNRSAASAVDNTERHHTRGRSDDSDTLDVCGRCHLHCFMLSIGITFRSNLGYAEFLIARVIGAQLSQGGFSSSIEFPCFLLILDT